MASVQEAAKSTIDAVRDTLAGALKDDDPWSPEIPAELTEKMPKIHGRFPLTLPWSKPKAVDPDDDNVWIFDNTAFRTPITHNNDTAAKDVAAKDTAAKENPASDVPGKDSPVKDASAKETPAKDPPAKDPPAKSSKHIPEPTAISHRTTSNKPLADASWQVEYVAAYFDQDEDADNSAVVKYIIKQVGPAKGDTARGDTAKGDTAKGDTIKGDKVKGDNMEDTIKKRLEPFVVPILPRRTIRVNIGNVEQQTLGPSSSSGISSSIQKLHFTTSPDTKVVTTAADSPSETWVLPSDTIFAEPTGWGFISDIDDTMKITETPSIVGILKTTFIEEPRPVVGMPELYTHIHEVLNPAMFYLSASPYNLYPFLRVFRKQHYPDGTMILRDASWQNLAGLISSFREDVQEYKVDRMEKIHSWFSERMFVCIGDSTQKDPESYGEIARMFPGWIKAIFIRRVEDINEVTDVNQHEKNMPERFQKAFEGLHNGMWHVFDDPSEVKAEIDALVK